MVLIISQKDLQQILSMREAIDAIETGFIELAEGNVQMPNRQIMNNISRNGWIGVMSAYVKNRIIATKIVTVYPDNPKLNLPTTMATIILNDSETGIPLAVMDASYLTSVRTGALGGLAVRHLARKDARTVGIFGSGVQARAQLEAISEVMNIDLVYIFDLLPEASKRFAEEMSKKLSIKVVSVRKTDLAVINSDVIVTATTSKIPVFDGSLVKLGTHINAIGSHMSDMREIDTETVAKSKFIVDLKDVAIKEYGELIIPISEGVITSDHIYGDLGEIVTGKKKGRVSSQEITLFKSGGLAIQDAVTANLA
ncbi:MAG TPA: ornithine cyclodeaminase family protein, partial [Nitrososphaerales archaeon]